MSLGLPSDEVAEDYKNSLEDLTMNSRYEIANLTVIAKENLDHAVAIARVLENHIKTTAPNKKLPSLYVLDSVVKNVGTPYTLFFGRNLFQTFMNAYTLVDQPVRRKLEEMLKTWKEPVPGSMDSRPVFPPEVTRNIDNALIKARTAAVQLQQQQARSQQNLLIRRPGVATPPIPWRDTPTPPRPAPGYPPPQENLQYRQNYGGSTPGPAPAPYQPPFPAPPEHYQTVHPNPPIYQQPIYDAMNNLSRDIGSLIEKAKEEFARDPYDSGIQTRLKALLDLQEIVRSQELPADQLGRIRDQVAQLSLEGAAQHVSNFVPLSTHASPPPAPQIPQLQPAQQPQFPPGALAALLASTGVSQGATPPLPPSVTPSPLPPNAQSQNSGAPSNLPNGESSLLASLRAAGLLPGNVSSPTPALAIPAALPFPFPFPHPQNASTPTLSSTQVARVETAGSSIEIPLKSSAMKEFRPSLIKLLYEARPSQCTTCGRRFISTEEGKQKKARHLDWHFRVNQRMVDAIRRGQSRSWYVGEMEWIKTREDSEQGEAAESNGNNSLSGGVQNAATTKKDPKKRWLPVPSDPALANLHCPICQEKFVTVWLDEAQEWVWMDAVKVGGRIYHASCHEEATKDRGPSPARNSTPDSVLGKRKVAESDLSENKTKIKKESAS